MQVQGSSLSIFVSSVVVRTGLQTGIDSRVTKWDQAASFQRNVEKCLQRLELNDTILSAILETGSPHVKPTM
jgi:hypothetical protein